MPRPFYMKIKRLHIQNFQSHKDTTIDFTDGLNVIVGPTDTGKSSIIRAIRKLIRDEPGGKSFISKWAKDMTISLVFEYNGVDHTVKRKLTSTKNLYYLDDQEYGGFGKTIPEEIQTALNMQLVTLETGDVLDLHFTDQHDVPFMISKGSAGIRSKLLGKVAGLHVLDRAISRINSDIRGQNSMLKHRAEEVSSLENELEDFPSLWHEYELIDMLGKQLIDLKSKIEGKERLQTVVDSLIDITSKVEKIQELLKVIPDIDKAKVNSVKITLTTHYQLVKIVQELNYCQENIKTLENSLPPEIKADFIGIRKKIQLHTRLYDLYDKLVILAQEAKGIKENDVQEDLHAALKEHDKILQELGMCPTCRRPLEDHYDH